MNTFHRFTLCFLMVVLASCGNSNSSRTSQNSEPTADIALAPRASSTDMPNTIQAAAPAQSSILLSWTIPTSRENGEPLTLADINGYEISYQRGSMPPEFVSITDSAETSHSFSNLTADDYLFVIFTYDADNNISSPSTPIFLAKSAFPSSQ